MWRALSVKPARLAVREHGGALPADKARSERLRDEAAIQGERLLDLSVNVNPYGPAPAVAAAVRNAPLHAYPDPTARPAREALARHEGCLPEAIVLGNGAADLLWTLAAVLLDRDDAALVVAPTFSEFAAAAVARRARVTEWRACSADRFAVDLDAVAAVIARARAAAVYLCSPNNPTGAAVPVAGVARLAAAFPRTTVLLDEAFLALSEGYADRTEPVPANVVRVRSLTKEHGIPGVRVGYLVAAPALAAAVEACRPAWTTSCFAQAAAVAACQADDFVAESRRRVLEDRVRLAASLATLGLQPIPSTASFILVRVDDGPGLQRRLLDGHGILVRECSSFGLPNYVRIAARPRADQERLIRALAVERGR